MHKIFLSFHNADRKAANEFIRRFTVENQVFMTRGLGIIGSKDSMYVMRKIREDYLVGSTVTIVLIGKKTWSRRYVDWEIQASLKHRQDKLPNGLIGIRLGDTFKIPGRLNLNMADNGDGDHYARIYDYPESLVNLKRWIDDAYTARSRRSSLVVNPAERFNRNRRV